MTDSISRAEFAMFTSSVKEDMALVRSDLKDLLKMNQEFLNKQILEDFKSEEQSQQILNLGTRQSITEASIVENQPIINFVIDKKRNYSRLMTAYFISFFGAAGLGTWKLLTDVPPPPTTPTVVEEPKT